MLGSMLASSGMKNRTNSNHQEQPPLAGIGRVRIMLQFHRRMAACNFDGLAWAFTDCYSPPLVAGAHPLQNAPWFLGWLRGTTGRRRGGACCWSARALGPAQLQPLQPERPIPGLPDAAPGALIQEGASRRSIVVLDGELWQPWTLRIFPLGWP